VDRGSTPRTCILCRVSGPLRALILLLTWSAAAVILSWGRISVHWRRWLALGVSAAGFVFLILALNTGGLREASSTGGFLLGSRYVTGTVSASASLPYYVMTGLCLLLGTAALALPESWARGWSRRWLLVATLLSLSVSLVRLILEIAAAPPLWTWAAGITGLAPLIGAYFAISLRAERGSWGRLVGSLLVYGVMVRAWVALLYVFATRWHLGSHYDLSAAAVAVRNPLTGVIYQFPAGSFAQLLNLAIVPQLVFWPLYTLCAGLFGAGLAAIAMWAWTRGHGPAAPPVPAPES
jgi:hypothetical protein